MYPVFEENDSEVSDQLIQLIHSQVETPFFQYLSNKIDARGQFKEMTRIAVSTVLTKLHLFCFQFVFIESSQETDILDDIGIAGFHL